MTSAETRAAFAKHIFNDEGVRVEWHGGEPGHESFGVWVSLSHGWFVWQAAYAAGVGAGLEAGAVEVETGCPRTDEWADRTLWLDRAAAAIRSKRKEQQGG